METLKIWRFFTYGHSQNVEILKEWRFSPAILKCGDSQKLEIHNMENLYRWKSLKCGDSQNVKNLSTDIEMGGFLKCGDS